MQQCRQGSILILGMCQELRNDFSRCGTWFKSLSKIKIQVEVVIKNLNPVLWQGERERDLLHVPHFMVGTLQPL